MELVPQAILSYESEQISPENDAWSETTTYAISDKVNYGNHIWICAKAGSIGVEPTDDSTDWTKWGVSNYWSLIDLRSQTLTVYDEDLIVTFDKVGIETLVIGYFRGISITAEVLDASNNVIFTNSFINPRRSGFPSWRDYIHADFTDYSSKSKVLYLPSNGIKVRVAFAKGTYSQVQVGYLIGGKSIEMGRTKEGVKLGTTSYTTNTTDDFGITTIVKRAKRKYYDFETMINSEKVIDTLGIVDSYGDDVLAFIIDNDTNSKFNNIVTLGVAESVEPIATNQTKTALSWTVIEMI